MAMRLLDLVYLMLPAYAANLAAPFAKFWPGWNRPINSRWLGGHKTVVGFALGVVASLFTAYLQSHIPWSPRGFDMSTWLAIAFAQGISAMGGDAAKSFFKRRIGTAPGKPWIPADQLDFIIGALAVLAAARARAARRWGCSRVHLGCAHHSQSHRVRPGDSRH
jgi:CDP-2,3-bis-(O-geranylgeranyl)-sn-glycerol synthase